MLIDEMHTKALEYCHSVLTKKLHIQSLAPLLHDNQLLTLEDSRYLLNEGRSHEEITDYLVNNLPRKKLGWFSLLLECLEQSTFGTGHDAIIKALETECRRLSNPTKQNVPIEGVDSTVTSK